MKKTIPYFLALLVLLGGLAIFFNEELFTRKEVPLDDALIKAEDFSGTDFYVHLQERNRADYYDLPITIREYSITTRVYLGGTYQKDENRIISLTSWVTKYVGNAAPYFEDATKMVGNNLGNTQLEDEFIPEFETSSFYEYRECAKTPSQVPKKAYSMCVVSKAIKENYLFVLLLQGNGAMTNDDLENILEIALNNKKETLERLP